MEQERESVANENKSDWKSLDFRQHAVASIQTAVNMSGAKLRVTAVELERRAFRKSHSMETYFTRITRCIHYVYVAGSKPRESPSRSQPCSPPSCSSGQAAVAVEKEELVAVEKEELPHSSRRASLTAREASTSDSSSRSPPHCPELPKPARRHKKSRRCSATAPKGDLKREVCPGNVGILHYTSDASLSERSDCSEQEGCPPSPRLVLVDQELKRVMAELAKAPMEIMEEQNGGGDGADDDDLEWIFQ